MIIFDSRTESELFFTLFRDCVLWLPEDADIFPLDWWVGPLWRGTVIRLIAAYYRPLHF